MPESEKRQAHVEPKVSELVVTLGPSSLGKEVELAEHGATQFRINASHMTVERLCESIKAAQEAVRNVPVVVDLQGAKMRLGDFVPRAVTAGDSVRFAHAALESGDFIPLPHEEVYAALTPGDSISIDDGRLVGTVESVSGDTLQVRFAIGGTLLPRKGFNRDDHPVILQGLCARDVAMVRAAYGCGCRAFAVSFVVDGRECQWVRQWASDARLIAKIERQDALSNLELIARSADELWICRGDLGVQLGILNLGRAIGRLEPKRHPIPTYMAGQVLEHLTSHREPTRSEVCHVHDLVSRGYAGIVLSDETAIGCDAVNAARVARALLDA